MATSPAGLKWRRAIAAASAISLFSTALKWFTMSDEGLGAALVFGSPALVVGSLAAWWAWRGYAVRATPAVVVALLSALLGGGLTFIAAFAVLSWSSGGDASIAGPPALIAALIGALLAGAIGFARQRAHRTAAAAIEPNATAPAVGPDASTTAGVANAE